LSWITKKVILWSNKGLYWLIDCLRRELRLIKLRLIWSLSFLFPLIWSKSDLSFAMLNFIGDLLKTLAKWLAHLLTSFLKILLLSLMNLMWRLLKSFDLYWCPSLLCSPLSSLSLLRLYAMRLISQSGPFWVKGCKFLMSFTMLVDSNWCSKNYSTTEKALIAIVFALDKFRSCLLH